jgi:hypothetical protein
MTNTATTFRDFTQKLSGIVENEPNTIRAYVSKEALGYNDSDPILMFRDLERCGCIGGAINSLIYYHDTHAFFDRFYEEIEQLRDEQEREVGEQLHIQGDLKNWLAWFAFEEVALQIANELNIEL